jgi:poly-gamma-glutamate capsule biosynthesis protein CapA/YwtB (metallophosphatase superfamily)
MSVSVISVGDVYIKRKNPQSAFQKMKPVFEKSDLVFANLETPLTDRETPALGRLVPLKTTPAMVEGIVHAGVDIVSLANNHTTDYGPAGLVDTMNILDENDTCHVGAGHNFAESHNPELIEKKGVKIAFLAYECTIWSFGAEGKEKIPGAAKLNVSSLLASPHIDKGDLKVMKEDVRKAKETADVVVASFHWGVDLSCTVAPHQKAMAYQAVDSGADVILGHHPHRLQGIEVYNGKVIFYSLGNILFDMMFQFPQNTVAAETILSEKGLEEAYVHPIYITKSENDLFDPTIPDVGNFEAIVSELKELSEEFGTNFVRKGEKVEIILH